MVLVARRGERLRGLEEELRRRHPELEVHGVAADLSDPAVRRGLAEAIGTAEWQPTLLVNNAGMGDYGEFVHGDWGKLRDVIELNVTALTHLTHLFLPGMIRRGEGAIVNVSSLAGELPIPDIAVYAATKAYVTSFSEALRAELREHRIPVVAVCPGPVHTEFGCVAARGGRKVATPGGGEFYVEADEVVAAALRGLRADRARVFPGWKVALLAAALSVMPAMLVRFAMSSRPRRIPADD